MAEKPNLCRICLKLISINKKCYHLKNLDQKLLDCVPEIDFSIPFDPVLCTKCYTSLQSMQVFKHLCFQTENLVQNFRRQSIPFDEIRNHLDTPEKCTNTIYIKQEVDDSFENDIEIDTLEIIDDCCIDFNTDIQVDIKVYHCFNCSFKSENRKVFVMHTRTHRCFKCDVCEFTSSCKRTLKTHKISHVNIKSESSLTFDTQNENMQNNDTCKESVFNIIKYEDRKLLKYNCKLCDYQSNCSAHFKSHVRCHNGTKWFQCEKCPYRTGLKTALSCHMRKHTGEKPFKCEMCSYCTTQISSLNTHKKAHSRKPTMDCHNCDFKTIHMSSFRKHLLACNDWKPDLKYHITE